MQHPLRTTAFILVTVAGVIVAIAIGEWAARPRSVLIPLALAYFLFGFGFLFTNPGIRSPGKATRFGKALGWLAVITGWLWCLLAGGGGLGILLLRGPWPPTNGWFALFSGLAACPLIGRVLRNSAHIKVYAWQQFGAAALLVAMGRLALTVWPQPNPL
jgi:hypothetical protein